MNERALWEIIGLSNVNKLRRTVGPAMMNGRQLADGPFAMADLARRIKDLLQE